jgi:hypothetical protein
MISPIFEAIEEKTSPGIYLIRFTPDNKGIYTVHVHVVPDGRSMHSMMENHLDIRIIAKDKD